MKNSIAILMALMMMIGFSACNKAETCTDGIKNQTETGIDCGGVCAACPTCDDGIKNQGEVKIDCGGPCDACCVTCEKTGYPDVRICEADYVDHAAYMAAIMDMETGMYICDK